MIFSKACEYGIRAVIFLADRAGKESNTRIGDIAAAIESPEAFTSKILQALVRKGIVNSSKGKTGGFSLPESKLNTLRIRNIVDAIDGPAIFSRCVMGLNHCSEINPCPLHHRFKEQRQRLTELMQQDTLAELLQEYRSRNTFLKIHK